MYKKREKNSKMPSCFSFLLLCLFAGMLVLLCSCNSNKVYVFSEGDALTSREQEAIIEYIRYFVNRSNLRLSKAERNFIRNTPPTFKVHYTGKKRGELTVKWNFPNFRTIILKRKGYLLFEGKIHWDVRILTDMASPTIPRHFYGARGEDIRMMRPEAEKILKQWQGDPPPEKK